MARRCNPRVTFLARKRLKNGKLAKTKTRVSFVAGRKRAARKTRTVYPTKGAPRTISAAGLAKMRANGRKQFRANGLAKFAKKVKTGQVRRRRGKITGFTR
jgi:hypothetical protein